MLKILYNDFENWAINTCHFYINVNVSGTEADLLKKYYFSTDQVLEIQEILDVYTSRKAGKDEKDIEKIISKYREKFSKILRNFPIRGYSVFPIKSE